MKCSPVVLELKPEEKLTTEDSSTPTTMAFCSTPTTPVTVTVVSESMVKPTFISEDSKKPHYLSPLDVPCLNYVYLQLGLLFNKPGDDQPMQSVLDRLKNSFATTLTHFIPFSGRFVTQVIQHPPSYSVYVDCNDPPGAGFVHALAPNLTISDILTPTYVPRDIIKSLFALPPDAPNSQGHNLPLLIVQVNELLDGIFISFTANHALVDGTSFWNFLNSYSEVCRSNTQEFVISHPPVISTWFSEDQVRIPGCPPSPSSGRIFTTTPSGTYVQRVFHFSFEALTCLKKKANSEHGTHKISTYQALAALIWRALTRARGLSGDQLTICAIPINCRSKLEPPLSHVYFGNVFIPEFAMETANKLLKNTLGWTASTLHDRLSNWDNNKVRSFLEQLSTSDHTLPEEVGWVILGNSPRFNIYGNNFGWGNPLAVRWSGEFSDGMVQVLSGHDNGSIDIIVDLFSGCMNALESDEEFISSLSCMEL